LTNDRARDYLLGRLPETDAEALEGNLLQNEELFVEMRSAESDLYDDFARGDLSDADRQAFLDRYRDPGRLRFARALAKRGSNVVAMPARAWIGWAAAAALVIVIAGAVFRSPEHSKFVVTSVSRSVAVTLTLGTSRSAGEITKITMPRDTTTLHLSVKLDPNDRFDSYSLELRSGAPVWRADHLQQHESILTADVPVKALPDGSYELAVRGGDEDLGFVELEVHRQP
jgi:hypothetical protein